MALNFQLNAHISFTNNAVTAVDNSLGQVWLYVDPQSRTQPVDYTSIEAFSDPRLECRDDRGRELQGLLHGMTRITELNLNCRHLCLSKDR